jgi:TM2 domain-containing membrane protein YozV
MKSKTVAFLFWFFLGGLSIHRFYLGKIGSGIIYLFTGQLFLIGWIVDLFLLSGMVDNCNNKERIKNLEREAKSNRQ